MSTGGRAWKRCLPPVVAWLVEQLEIGNASWDESDGRARTDMWIAHWGCLPLTLALTSSEPQAIHAPSLPTN